MSRNLYCPSYGECLAFAAGCKWDTFSCPETCELREIQEPPPPWEVLACINLITVLCAEPHTKAKNRREWFKSIRHSVRIYVQSPPDPFYELGIIFDIEKESEAWGRV